MFREGLGETTEFAGYHPIVNLIYFAFAIGITMFSMDTIFLAITFVMSWVYSLLLGGKKQAKFNLFIMIPMVVFMAVINALVSHNGATVLFYINTNRITVESFVFGIAAAVMLTAVIIWFSCFNVIMTSDKFIYLFGKVAPVLGLTLSMIFRFIPLLKSRFKEISMGQKCMGREASGLIGKIRQFFKEVSILISWSLEASIETSDSMEARGYGLRGRTSFHLFKMTGKDYRMLAALGVTGGISTIGCIMDKTDMYYFPEIILRAPDLFTVIVMISYIIMLALPIIIDMEGERKWQTSK